MSEAMVVSAPQDALLGTGSLVGAAPSVTMSNDWNKDLAAMAAESVKETPAQPVVGQPQQAVVTPPATQTPAIPATQAAAPAIPVIVPPVEVPEKFRGPDGKLDQEKVLKSYFDAEKALKKAQNALGAQPAATPAAVPAQPGQPQPAQAQQQLSPFELQVAQDLFSQGGFTEQQAMAQARVMVRLSEAKHRADTAATFAEVNQFREALAQQQQRTELQSLAERNPEVLTPQGYAELVKVREENPWINNAPEPWKAAAHFLLGQKQMYGQAGLVNIPTPKGVQQAVPPLPVTPAQTVQNPIALNTPEQIQAYVSTLSPENEGEFWKKMGLKWETPKVFKGI